MSDPRFYKFKGSVTVAKIAESIGAKLVGNAKLEITNIATLSQATQNDISFLTNSKYLNDFKTTKAGACLVSLDFNDTTNQETTLLMVADPHSAYAHVCEMLYEEIVGSYNKEAISPNANIDASVKIGHHTVIEDAVTIGAGTIIGHNTTIHQGVVIGKNCHIASNCTLANAIIGDNCVIYPGARIGQDGFGYAASSTGIKKVMQLGRVVLHNNVEIGANTCVDRGAIEDTVISESTKLDNLIQIAHNVQIGSYCFLAAQTGIAGSSKVGNQAMIGGQVGISGHINLGNRITIAAQSGIVGNLKDTAIVMGSPSMPKGEYLRCVAWLRKNALKK